jgi:putative membrane protein insertion efficiency factor
MRAVRRSLLWLIRGYQLVLSPWFGGHCRFYPSCSRYAHIAIEQHGALRGVVLSLRRLLRCHPLNAGGYDPVPGRE